MPTEADYRLPRTILPRQYRIEVAPDLDPQAITAICDLLIRYHIDALIARSRKLLGDNRYRLVFETGLNVILDDIRDDLGLFGVFYQEWYSERSLTESGAVNKVIDRLRE